MESQAYRVIHFVLLFVQSVLASDVNKEGTNFRASYPNVEEVACLDQKGNAIKNLRLRVPDLVVGDTSTSSVHSTTAVVVLFGSNTNSGKRTI